MHATAHDLHAALDRRALGRRQARRYTHYPLKVQYQVAFGRQGVLREVRRHFARQRCAILLAVQYRYEALQQHQRGVGRHRRFVLNGIGNAAQQVGAGHGGAQRRGQLWNSQRKGARNVRQDPVLVSLVGYAGVGLERVARHCSNCTTVEKAPVRRLTACLTTVFSRNFNTPTASRERMIGPGPHRCTGATDPAARLRL